MGLLALMLLQESRRAARTSPDDELVLLENQDRSLWNREQIAEGVKLVERALLSRRFGPYTLQAAIAAVHSEAPDVAATDWPQIVALYSVLAQAEPSPVVELNRAVAMAMRVMGRRPDWRSSMPFSRTAGCWIITSRTRHGRICAAAWAGKPRPVPPTNAPWRSRGWNRNGGSLKNGCENWDKAGLKISSKKVRGLVEFPKPRTTTC